MSTSGLSKPKSGSGEIVVPFSAFDQIKDVIGVWTAGERLQDGFGVSVTSLMPGVPGEPSGLNVWDNRGNSVTVMVFENELRVRWGIYE